MPRESLRSLLETEEVVLVPGAWDGLSALLVQEAGFPAVFSSGYAIAASLGMPDSGLYTMTENLEAIRQIADVTDIPIIADIDTGYGGAVNVMRTVREFERIGAAAVILEDQLEPKQCPLENGGGAPLISKDEALGKLRAALDARSDPELVLVARTDAIGEEAIERACAYAEAGADMITTVGPAFSSVEEVKACQRAHGKPMMLTLAPGEWAERDFTRERLVECNVKLALVPIQILYAAVKAMRDRLIQLRETQYAPDRAQIEVSHEEFAELLGFEKIEELQRKYMPALRAR